MSHGANDINKTELCRRDMLKLAATWVLAGISVPLFPPLSTSHAAQTTSGGEKALIVYYSRTGNTREIARQIHQRVGGEIIEIQTARPYPDDYEAVKEQAMQQLNSGFKPALKTKIKEIGAYDIIFIGTPIWWGRIAAPVKSFLSQYDLSGKTIALFNTHAGSGLGQSMSDIKALCPSSTIPDGLAVWGKDAGTAQSKVSEWTRKIIVKK